jgi:hypothetical protein
MTSNRKNITWCDRQPETREASSLQTAFEDRLKSMLRESHRPEGALQKSQTHTGEVRMAENVSYDVKEVQLSRSMSCPEPDDGTLDIQAFFQRSSILMRDRQPYKSGRGYNHPKLAAFKPQDGHVWRQIMVQDWSQEIGPDVDVLFYMNHWFSCNFRREIVQLVISLDPNRDTVHAIVSGDAIAVDHDWFNSVNEQSIESVSKVWICVVCQRPSQGDDEIGAKFCVSCHTSRHDAAVWKCPGTEKERSLPKHLKKPCGQLMRMQDWTIGIPCCFVCGVVRHRFHEDEVFAAFSNKGDMVVSPAGEERALEPDEPQSDIVVRI